MKRASLIVALLAVITCADAAAHEGGGAALGYRSTVTAVTPKLPAVYVDVLGGDEELRLSNNGSRPIVVLGYQGEPYLRVASNGVFENRHSPAAYLNQERYGGTPVPATANANAKPKWVRVSRTSVAEWHDHRIHWMSKTPPPKIQANPDEAQTVFDWTVPLRVQNVNYKVSGRLAYAPPAAAEGGGSHTILLVTLALAAIVLAAAAAFVLTRRRRSATEHQPV